MTSLRDFFNAPLNKDNGLSILIATFCFAAMCVYAALYFDASRCDMRRNDYVEACVHPRIANHFWGKSIMKSSLPAAIKRELLKPGVGFSTGVFEHGHERPVGATMYRNDSQAYCIGEKCIIYLIKETLNAFNSYQLLITNPKIIFDLLLRYKYFMIYHFHHC